MAASVQTINSLSENKGFSENQSNSYAQNV